MRFYARFACENPHFHTSWYKISYDTRAKNVFLTNVITSLAFGSCYKLTLVRKSFIALVSECTILLEIDKILSLRFNVTFYWIQISIFIVVNEYLIDLI